MSGTPQHPIPAVSVIIPAYNVAPFIGETLESLFAQTFRDFEAIVVNDGSTDDTESKLAPYLDRIIYIRQENSGPAAARNAGIRHARGRYIALLDGDDVWMPNFLECLVGMLEHAPEAAVAFPNAVFFGATPLSGKLFQDLYPCSGQVTFERILTRQVQIFGGLIFRRNLLKEVGQFDATLRSAEDLDLWLRISQRGYSFLSTSEPLVRYRRREDCLSHDGATDLRSCVRVLEKITAAPVTTGEQRVLAEMQLVKVRAQLNLAIGKQRLLERDFISAAKHLELANNHFRSLKLTLVTLAIRVAPGWAYRLYQARSRE